MNSLLIAALAVLASPTLTMAKTQAAPVAPAPVQAPAPAAPSFGQGAAATGVPILAPAVASPDCGAQLRSPAFCVTAQLDQVGALADAYLAQFEKEGWLPAAGDDNRVILIKRRENGGCDGMQMIAFYDESKPAEATAPGYLGFATIPGDVCAGQPAPAAGATPQ
ncbi:hypothetical protein [Brevundimonas pondensis]|uniref:Uncharacterized protein n=1 Tax=Brevundimonas pondensis TaxID=2774189 RepID=A0ABX7SNE6_9CAUL|nr:hypothetical protein [Brevundimonas pondensis]QTC87855.1 hypothetical protein IFE19_00085 [Brevundimonas pondensis]